MKIAIVTEVFLPKIDGITNRLANTVRELKDAGHEVMVIAPHTAVPEYQGAEVLRVGSLPFPPYPGVRICWPSPRILTRLATFAPDVVHLVGPANLGLWAAMYARMRGLTMVGSYHTDLPRYMPLYGFGWLVPYYWPLMRMVHNRAMVNLCPSSAVKAELEANGVRNVGIWRGGVDTERFNPAKRSRAMRHRLTGGDPDAPLALYVGRVGYEKGLDTLGPVLETYPDLRMAIVGDGPARPSLEQRYAPHRVVFTGFLGGEELATAFASADMFIMPSRTETLGFVTLEAMCSGLAVIAADAGGTTDLVKHGENGVLYDPETPQTLLDAVGELLDNPGKRWALAYAAREYAEGCTWTAETEGLVGKYRQAIELAGGTVPADSTLKEASEHEDVDVQV